MARKSTERLIDDAAGALRRYHDGGQRDPDLLREAATAIVEIRSRLHRDKDGVPDWSGRTKLYRDAAAEIYSRAGFIQGAVEGWQRKIGYYVRQALDERDIPAHELEAAGIQPLNPKVRQTRKRTLDAAVAAAFARDTTAANRAVFAERLLAQAAAEDIAALSPSDRVVLTDALNGVDAHTANLRGAVADAETPAAG